jgi:hypothetical protein
VDRFGDVSAEKLHEEEAAARQEWHGAANVVRRAVNDGGEKTGLSAEH